MAFLESPPSLAPGAMMPGPRLRPGGDTDEPSCIWNEGEDPRIGWSAGSTPVPGLAEGQGSAPTLSGWEH